MAEEDKKEKVELDRLKLPKAQARNNSEETEASIQQLHSGTILLLRWAYIYEPPFPMSGLRMVSGYGGQC